MFDSITTTRFALTLFMVSLFSALDENLHPLNKNLLAFGNNPITTVTFALCFCGFNEYVHFSLPQNHLAPLWYTEGHNAPHLINSAVQ